MDLLNILLMSPQTGEGEGSGYGTFIPLILIVVVFYFFFIRPQTKKSKEQKKYRESLSKGDKIITIGGIHGKILEVKETSVIIETEGQGRLKVEKSAVSNDSSGNDQLAQKK
ncbi:MAG: preprotein translocase subunit YajC [Saprospiraceae bacterium]|nr:preprotein translocase subunit YajC [Saprospiraceae bacterium]